MLYFKFRYCALNLDWREMLIGIRYWRSPNIRGCGYGPFGQSCHCVAIHLPGVCFLLFISDRK